MSRFNACFLTNLRTIVNRGNLVHFAYTSISWPFNKVSDFYEVDVPTLEEYLSVTWFVLLTRKTVLQSNWIYVLVRSRHCSYHSSTECWWKLTILIMQMFVRSRRRSYHSSTDYCWKLAIPIMQMCNIVLNSLQITNVQCVEDSALFQILTSWEGSFRHALPSLHGEQPYLGEQLKLFHSGWTGAACDGGLLPLVLLGLY